MAITSSFFNSVDGDRIYKAENFASYFASFIGNGVFPNPSNGLMVTATSNNMTVTLKQGTGWINGYYIINDADYNLTLDPADGVLKRIDRIVLRWSRENRNIMPFIKKGALSATPVAPTLQRDMDFFELGLADVLINKGVIKVDQSNVTDTRLNKSLCGIVTGVIDQVDTTDIFNQYQTFFNNWSTEQMNEFTEWSDDQKAVFLAFSAGQQALFLEWFDSIKGQLSGDQAGNLLNLINALKLDLVNHGFSDMCKTYNGDLNTLKTNGLYYYSGSSASAPTSSYGYVFVESASNLYVKQTYCTADNKGIFVRTDYNGTWGAWIQQETTAGAQAKATTALNDSKAYTDSQVNTPSVGAQSVLNNNSLNVVGESNSDPNLVVSGNSMVNINTVKSHRIVAVAGQYSQSFSPLVYAMKANTDYTIYFKINSETNIKNAFVGLYDSISVNIGIPLTNSELQTAIPKGYAIKKIAINSDKVIKLGFYSNNTTNVGGEIFSVDDVTFIEGDHTAEPVSYFQGLQSVSKNINVLSVGKNLIDVNNLSDKYVSILGGYKKYKLILPNGSYNWSMKENYFLNSGMYALFTDNESFNGSGTPNSWIGHSTSSANCNVKGAFNVTKGIMYLAVNGDDNLTKLPFLIQSMQLEKGNTATEYETYKSNQTNLKLYAPLRSLPNGTADTVEYKNGKAIVIRRCGEVVLDGSESWEVVKTNTDGSICFRVNNLFDYNLVSAQGRTDKFKFLILNYVYEDGNMFLNYSSSGTATKILYINTKVATTAATFKTWLQANNTKVIYELATPTVEEYTLSSPVLYKNGSVFFDTGAIYPSKLQYMNALNLKSQMDANTYGIANLKTVVNKNVEDLETSIFDTGNNLSLEDNKNMIGKVNEIQPIPNTVYTIMKFGNIYTNSPSDLVYNTDLNYIKCNKGGLYQISVTGIMDALPPQKFVRINMQILNADKSIRSEIIWGYQTMGAGSNAFGCATGSNAVQLYEGEYVAFAIYHNGGTNLNLITHSRFTVTRLNYQP